MKTKPYKKVLAVILAFAMILPGGVMFASANCEHDFSVKKVLTAPTCTTKGLAHYLCSKCDEDEGIDYILNTIHENIEKGIDTENCDEWTVTTPATCTAKGEKTTTCLICGDPITVEIAATGHDEGIWSLDFEANEDHDGQMSCRCTACGEVLEVKSFKKHAHTYGYDAMIKYPSCTEAGEEGTFCDECGAMYATTVIPALGHSCKALDDYWSTSDPLESFIGYHDVDAVMPTCTEAGSVVFKCNTCGEPMDTFVVPATGHESYALDNWTSDDPMDMFGYANVDVAAPTCTENGVVTVKCDTCGETIKTFAVEATGHYSDALKDYLTTIDTVPSDYIGWPNVESVEPTCTDKGAVIFKCDTCGAVMRKYDLDPLGHDNGTWRIDYEPTANHPGQKTRYCNACGLALESEDITLHTHSVGYKAVTIPATCTADGEMGVYCGVCGVVFDTEVITATGHTSGFDKIIKEATCMVDGEMGTFCGVCGKLYATAPITATGHTNGYEKIVKEATCTVDGEMGTFCGVCGEIYATAAIAATGHTFGYEKVVTPATCTDEGKMGKFCAVCGELYDTEVIPVIEHAYDSWYKNGDGTHSRGCSRCQYVETANCDYDVIVTPPTCTEIGYTTYTCKVCGYTYVDDYVDALGHDWGEWTDDGNGESHTRVCARCGETETECHDFSCWTFNHDAKLFKNGTKTRYCLICDCVETEEAHHTSYICQVFYPIILWLGSLAHKSAFIASLCWFLPFLNIRPEI